MPSKYGNPPRSGVKGVRFVPYDNVWTAVTTVYDPVTNKNKPKYVGRFSTREEAEAAEIANNTYRKPAPAVPTTKEPKKSKRPMPMSRLDWQEGKPPAKKAWPLNKEQGAKLLATIDLED